MYHIRLGLFVLIICSMNQQLYAVKKKNKKPSRRDIVAFVINGTTVYQCRYCNKVYTLKSNCRTHERKNHEMDLKFTCRICDKKYLNRSDLNRHMCVHSENRPFKCNYCGECFKRIDALYTHCKAQHKLSHPYKCSICGKKFWHRSARKKHMNVHHVPENNASDSNNQSSSEEIDNFGILCQECGKLCIDQNHLNVHKKYCRIFAAYEEFDSDSTLLYESLQSSINTMNSNLDNDIPTYIPYHEQPLMYHITYHNDQLASLYNQPHMTHQQDSNCGSNRCNSITAILTNHS